MSSFGKDGSSKVVMDVFSFSLSISSAIFIVFVNKILMGTSGYAFTFATTLCSFHFLSCWIYISFAQLMGWVKKISIPFFDALLFCLIADVSIASLNLSLMINSVGFYQMAKLLNIPFIAIVEFIFYKKRFSLEMLVAMIVTILGVAIVTVSDVQVHLPGLIMAGIGIVSSGMQQLEAGRMQRKHKVQASELLSNTAPLQCITLLVVGPFVDKIVTQKWIIDYDFHIPAIMCILATCAIAIAVNVSQFMCLGRFSASTYQVLGHSKTILVLVGSWLLLDESITRRQLCGMILAVSGMIAYGMAASKFKLQPKPEPQNNEQTSKAENTTQNDTSNNKKLDSSQNMPENKHNQNNTNNNTDKV